MTKEPKATVSTTPQPTTESLADAARLVAKREAQERLIESFGKDADVTEAEADRIRALWRG